MIRAPQPDPRRRHLADRRDEEIERLRKECENLRAREERARSEAEEARARLRDFASRSRSFATAMNTRATDRHRVRRRIMAQYQIGRALETSPSLEEAAPKVFEVLGEGLGWDRGVLWKVDAEAGVLHCDGIWGAPDRPAPEEFARACRAMRLAPGEGLPGRAWEGGEVFIVEEIPGEASYEGDPRREYLVEEGLTGALAFSVHDGGGVSAVFELFCCEVPEADEDLRRTMSIIGHQIGQFVERRRAEKEREELLVREREARAEAEASRREVSGLLESINDAFFALDEERRVTYANRQMEKLWGGSRGDLTGRNIWEALPMEVGTKHYEAVEEALEEGEDTNFESYSSGLGAWISGRVYPSPGGVSVFFRDVTERKEAEEKLRESEERFRVAFEQAQVGVVQASLDGRILVPNPGFCEIIGYAPKEARGLHVRDITHPDDYEADMEQARRVIRGEIPGYSLEKRYVRKDGSVVWVNLTSTVARGDDGEPLYALAIVEDVDERKRAEEAVLGAAERDRFRVALADALRPLTDPLEIQAAATRVLGERLAVDRVMYADVDEQRDEVVIADNYVKDGVPKLVGRFRAKDFGLSTEYLRAARVISVSDIKTDTNMSEQERASYGALGIVSFIAVPLIKGGRWVSNFGVYHFSPREWSAYDILLVQETAERTWAAVERARVEEALRESEVRFRRVFSNNMVPMAVWSWTGEIAGANDAMLDLVGYTREELEAGSLDWTELTPPEYRQRDEEALAEVRTHGACTPYEKEFVHKSGRRVPIVIGGGRFDERAGTGILFAVDLAERKEAEEALRASEERFRALVTQATVGIAETTDDGRFTYVNDRFCEITGRRREDLIGARVGDITHPDEAERDMGLLENMYETGEPFVVDKRYVRPDGPVVWVLNSVTPTRDAVGRITGGFAASIDVTERKEAEEALRESEERYRSLTTATSSIVWTGAADGSCVEEMPAWEEYTGQTFEEYRGFGWLDAVHPEDRPPEDAWEELDGKPRPTEARFRLWSRADEEYRRVVSRGVPIFDEDGVVREYIGTITDIEDELRAQEALGETEAKLMGLFDSDVVGIVWGEEQTITECNGAMLGMLGYIREELEDGGLYWPAVTVPEEQGRIQASIREGKETGRMTPFEKIFVRKDGERVPTIFGGYCLEAEPFRYVAFVLDISDRKKAEAERDRYLARELRTRAQAEERKRLSRELHDRVAHAIAVVHQSLELYEALKERNPAGAESRMSLAREMTREALHYTRDLSNRLRNPEVEGGLSAALSNLLSTTVPPHIDSEISFEGDELLIPPGAREQLFLILREAVRNAVAHSGASHLKIGLAVGEEGGVVTGYVEDDGEGFEARGDGGSPLRAGGTRSMRERAELLGGTLRLESAPGAGTRVEATVPLEEGE